MSYRTLIALKYPILYNSCMPRSIFSAEIEGDILSLIESKQAEVGTELVEQVNITRFHKDKAEPTMRSQIRTNRIGLGLGALTQTSMGYVEATNHQFTHSLLTGDFSQLHDGFMTPALGAGLEYAIVGLWIGAVTALTFQMHNTLKDGRRLTAIRTALTEDRIRRQIANTSR